MSSSFASAIKNKNPRSTRPQYIRGTAGFPEFDINLVSIIRKIGNSKRNGHRIFADDEASRDGNVHISTIAKDNINREYIANTHLGRHAHHDLQLLIDAARKTRIAARLIRIAGHSGIRNATDIEAAGTACYNLKSIRQSGSCAIQFL